MDIINYTEALNLFALSFVLMIPCVIAVTALSKVVGILVGMMFRGDIEI